jgi:superfamily I DNA and RNA helicase
MVESEQIFTDEQGKPKYSFENEQGQPKRDEVLPVCYRNTPWALTCAHAIGFGIHRSEGTLIQHFSNPRRWERVGYVVEEGQLEFGSPVLLKRRDDSFPDYFEEELSADDAIVTMKFPGQFEQAEQIAEDIRLNLENDELEADDILIILPVPYYAKSDYATIRDALTRRNIPSHLVGVDTDQDDVFLRESIAVTHIYRAKGNEAPMVYIANANRYLSYFTELTGRNMLFTAITRSRAWIRIFGIGDYMDRLIKEINATRSDGYKLRFTIPTQEQQKIMERVHVTVTPEERELQRENAEHIKRLLSAIKDGTIKKSDFSKEDRRLLAGLVLDEFGDVDE